MDPFSDIIALLRPHAVFSKPITGKGEWGVRYPAYGAPGFAIVLSGQCWLAVEADEPVLLQRGDFVLLPSSPAFEMLSRPGAPCVPGQPMATDIRHGDPGGAPDFRMLGGSFRLSPVNAPLLVALLPKIIHVSAANGSTRRLAGIIDLIMEECATERPGREMILERLLEVLLMECLRWPGAGTTTLPAGLLAGMEDAALARALGAMHADISAGWTVADLAKIAGMSRSAFAARFSGMLGCAPMEYLARWRMTRAKDTLSRGGTSLDRLAEDIGYDSASAFSTAFRRRVGCAPGAFARSRIDTPQA
ncbi:AraC family transcriptional regulator [Pararhizobium polonicum]|uniref:AraC family transcriptional regulator n=1 Tax=Pararhizobium polonicum TaxID=1612624 RepID=A0A1C7NXR6_9HYPH|nr:AraC family transcriptional regulator [Pararhizobium polonicum]OBZ93798.1 AraC family transcriptional regulator [Pararhizobium polonicum]